MKVVWQTNISAPNCRSIYDQSTINLFLEKQLLQGIIIILLSLEKEKLNSHDKD
jgi:hypothetical protein